MSTFQDFNLSKQLQNAIDDLGFTEPTPIQKESFSVILSGKDVVGIAQTGTGKTLGYMLPILRELKYSEQVNPRVLVLVPTRELVVQVVEQITLFTKYMSVRIEGIYGGVNINTQSQRVIGGMDVLVATPGRLYDLVLSRVIQLKDVRKLVIDEVDVMLDLGFRFQITNIMELLPERRQNIMFSATMTDDVEVLIDDFFVGAIKLSIAISGTPLENIEQQAYPVRNFYTKANLLVHLLSDRETFTKVLVFLSNKKNADRLFEMLEPLYGSEACIIHSNKSQNYRERSVRQFDEGKNRVLVATDVMARGLDMSGISHVINFDTPAFPENYMHRIGRTGRAQQLGKSLLFYTEKEVTAKEEIELLMAYEIPDIDFPEEVEVSAQLIPEERPKAKEINSAHKKSNDDGPGPAFHEKKKKNQKENWGSAYKREGKKFKKPRTRGDKKANSRRKKR